MPQSLLPKIVLLSGVATGTRTQIPFLNLYTLRLAFVYCARCQCGFQDLVPFISWEGQSDMLVPNIGSWVRQMVYNIWSFYLESEMFAKVTELSWTLDSCSARMGIIHLKLKGHSVEWIEQCIVYYTTDYVLPSVAVSSKLGNTLSK